MRFAEVAVDAPAGYDRTFSYSIPATLDARPGHLVRVPFGARTLQGVVFDLAPAPQVPQTKDIISTMGPDPVLSQVHLSLARWLSQYYMCPLFEAAALMLPPGGRARVNTYVSLKPDNADLDEQLDSEVSLQALAPLQGKVVDYIRSRGTVGQQSILELFGESARNTLTSLEKRGIILRSQASSSRAVGPKYRECVRLTAEACLEAASWLSDAPKRAPRRAALVARLLGDDAPLDLTEARKEYGAGAVSALLASGWMERESVPVERDPLAGMSFAPAPPVTLTLRQAAIASEIRAALDDPDASGRIFLVQGVTGSGKTEVYLAAVERCLTLGKRAIVMVPEISLTPQTIERFASRFPGQVAVLHSGLAAGERFDQWWKIRRGEYGVVIGSRSALFAPQPDLGLIVVDEEHEWTYKQHDASPRYHAREAALELARLTGAVVVLGSATPDVSSYYKGQQQEYRLVFLPERVSGGESGPLEAPGSAPMASVQVVDMRHELREGNSGLFSRALVSAMEECLGSRGQMILFLNRRGSAYMQCRSCGFGMRCRRCDVALTYHKQPDRLICHYCGQRSRPPAKCPSCLAYRMSFYGAGTQTVVEEMKRRFPETTALRWDRDTARGPKGYEELLRRFRSGEAQVLVGTQMIAKGLHFPEVTLVGVVSADVGLHIPDYRAGERTFQLLCQVAGRAGRGKLPGRVVIQTYQPDNYAIQAAASQDYQAFYRREMALRHEQANPPYTRLIRLLYTHVNQAQCEREAVQLAGLIKQQRDAWGLSDTELLGPTPAYPARLRGRYRWHMVLRGPQPRALLDKVTIPAGWVVDVDPVAMT